MFRNRSKNRQSDDLNLPDSLSRTLSIAVPLVQKLTGAKLIRSYAHGKQMLFEFSGQAWLGIHLGMTGELFVKPTPYPTGQHDHLVLIQKKQALIYRDPRLFGRVRFDITQTAPKWWTKLPSSILLRSFTLSLIKSFLKRRARAPIKSVLLMQETFPGIGNWMADEILWQARIYPKKITGVLQEPEYKKLFQTIRRITTQALKTVGKDFSDPPKFWLFHYRWKKKAACPRCDAFLRHDMIGGRTTCWCPKCQPNQSNSHRFE